MACTIQALGVCKAAPDGTGAAILRNCSLDVGGGGMTAIVGPSGAGKTSLLSVLSGLDAPDDGRVTFDGQDVYGMSDEQRTRFMRTRRGFVFQDYHLIPYLTLEENATLPLALAGHKPDTAALATLFMRFGLADRREAKASTCSGGEQQRCALIRALSSSPGAVFADEPTGALDTRNARVVLGALREMADGGCTVLLATHDMDAASLADRVAFMRDGDVVRVTGRRTSEQILAEMGTGPSGPAGRETRHA